MSEFYQGHDIVVRFDVFQDGEKVAPLSSVVAVYGPDREYIGKYMAEVNGSEVSFVLEGESVKKTGAYAFVFESFIKGVGKYTHVVRITVEDIPVEAPPEELIPNDDIPVEGGEV